ncbi:MAG: alpha/beta fold hydrolase [Dehalococcoidales bacterium]|jgi:pimeloyl-ACP methyl ester carboxylesterase
MPKVRVGDINVYYEIHGHGEPLVMICGASATTEGYTVVAPYFINDFRVVLYDNRGAGKTDKPDIPYSIKMMADDLAGLLDAIRVRSAYIYGQSMGGMIAQQFALDYPERVKKLVLICTTCGGRYCKLPKPSRRFGPEERQKMTPEELGLETLCLCVTQSYIERNPDTARMIMENMIKASEPAYAALRQAQAADCFNVYDRLPDIKAPTLVMGGEEDAAMPVENARLIASRIKGCKLVTFKKAGHILAEAGEKPNRQVMSFLKRNHSYQPA